MGRAGETEGETDGQTDKNAEGRRERTDRWRKTRRQMAEKEMEKRWGEGEGGQRDRQTDLGSRPSPHLPHLTSRTFFSVTSTWMTMG